MLWGCAVAPATGASSPLLPVLLDSATVVVQVAVAGTDTVGWEGCCVAAVGTGSGDPRLVLSGHAFPCQQSRLTAREPCRPKPLLLSVARLARQALLGSCCRVCVYGSSWMRQLQALALEVGLGVSLPSLWPRHLPDPLVLVPWSRTRVTHACEGGRHGRGGGGPAGTEWWREAEVPALTGLCGAGGAGGPSG